MQNNDFDQRIRQMLEQNEPAFDPAHWDRMEDMLQQLPASPNTGQSAGSGSGSLAGSMGAGAKALAIAAAVVVTGVNVAIYQYSQINNSPAAVETVQPAPANDVAKSTVLNTAENSIPESSATDVVDSEPDSEVPNNQHSNNQGLTTGKELILSPLVSFPPAGVESAETRAANPFAPASPQTVSFVSPCGSEKATPPYLILHTDTIRDLRVELSACEPQCLLIPIQRGSAVTWSDAMQVLPGASFLINEQTGVGSLCWTPTSDQAQAETFTVQFKAKDSRCPDANVSFALGITVRPPQAGQLVGDSVVKAGESARLQILQLPAGSAVRWRQAGGEWLSEQSNQLVITPLANAVYQAQVTLPNGCSRLLSQRVRLETPDFRAFIPNIFTPDGDGVNDRFILKDMEAGSASVEVFDRWGKRVYHSEHYNNSWEATGLPDGYYTYLITDLKARKVYRGGVTVSRGR
jgi:gliding motility-associated-like protein